MKARVVMLMVIPRSDQLERQPLQLHYDGHVNRSIMTLKMRL